MTKTFVILGLLWLSLHNFVFTQAPEPTYVIGVSILNSSSQCPVFIGGVGKDTPAAKAGIKIGDQLIAVDGNRVTGLQDAAQRVTSKEQKPVVLQLLRNEKPYTVTVQRENTSVELAMEGWKMIEGGILVKADASDSEIKHVLTVLHAIDSANGDWAVAFPQQHYPANTDLYYPGFEVFIWEKGRQVTVTGMEDGPGSDAGIRWGDSVLAINGVDPRGKSTAAVESLLSSSKPVSVTLTIDRGSEPKTFSFELEQASSVLRKNHKKIVNGKIVPDWVQDKYLSCFE